MGFLGDKSSSKGRATRKRAAGPGLAWKIWRFMADHPKGVLIGSATLLGLIVVFQNWNPTTAYLLVAPVKLPFILWALIFMVVGYLTGKYVEWGWRQRKIRKGTYKPRVSAEELAEHSAALDGRLDRSSDGGEPAPGGAPAGPRGAPVDQDDPATILDRRGGRLDRGHDRAVERVDYWADPKDGADARGKLATGERPAVEPGGRRAGGFSPAAEQAAQGSGPAPRPRREGEEHHGDRGRDSAREGGRYTDYGDAGRYNDYGDAGRYADYNEGGRYNDYADYSDGAPPGGRRRPR